MYHDVYYGATYNSLEMEATFMFINRRMDKDVIHTMG